MEEKSLLRLALICSLVGILALFFISENIEIKEKNINEINKDNNKKQTKLSFFCFYNVLNYRRCPYHANYTGCDSK